MLAMMSLVSAIFLRSQLRSPALQVSRIPCAAMDRPDLPVLLPPMFIAPRAAHAADPARKLIRFCTQWMKMLLTSKTPVVTVFESTPVRMTFSWASSPAMSLYSDVYFDSDADTALTLSL